MGGLNHGIDPAEQKLNEILVIKMPHLLAKKKKKKNVIVNWQSLYDKL